MLSMLCTILGSELGSRKKKGAPGILASKGQGAATKNKEHSQREERRERERGREKRDPHRKLSPSLL